MGSQALSMGLQQSVPGGLNFNWIVVTTNKGKRQLHMQWSPKAAETKLETTDEMQPGRLLLFPGPDRAQIRFAMAVRF
jgi:hypothetical protein